MMNEATPRVPLGGPIRVLLIEDDEVDGLWVKRALAVALGSRREFELEWANRVRLGEEYLKKKTFDVVLSDLKLPDGTGLEIFEMISRVAPKAPVVLLTGNLEEEALAVEALRRGAQDYLFKGRVDSEGLRRALHYAIERKRLHEALGQAKVRLEMGQRRLKNVIDVSVDGMLVVDKKRIIRYANPSAARFLGDTVEAILGKTYPHPMDVIHDGELLIGASRETQRVLEVRIETTQWQVEGAEDEEVFLICLHDVTERKRVEEKLKEINQMKSEFVRGVSHEFRTPLAIMKEGASQLIEGLAGPMSAQQRVILSAIHGSMDRLNRLVADLLVAARIEAGKIKLQWQQVNLADVVKDIVVLFKPLAEKKALSLKDTLELDGVWVDADKDRLNQILTNLMGNAIKFTEQGAVEVSLRDFGRRVEISVSDSGRGISKEDLSKMFVPFEQFGQRLKGTEKGTGLGLSISKALAELHGGALRAESEVGKGTRFTLSLPRRGREELFSILLQQELQQADEQHHLFALGAIKVENPSVDLTHLRGQHESTAAQNLEAIVKKTLRGSLDRILIFPDRVLLLVPAVEKKEASDIITRVEGVMRNFFMQMPGQDIPTLRSAGVSYPQDGKNKEELLATIQRELDTLKK